MKQKIITLLFAVIAFLGTKAATLAVVSGNCGENLAWTLNSKDSTLTIEGSGEMTSAPWNEYKLYVAYITFPADLTKIYEGSFIGCTNVKQLKVLSVTPPAGGANSGINASSCKLIIPQGSMEFYANAIWWEDFASIEEASNVTLPEYTVKTYATNGTVIGAGTYKEGTTVQLEAVPDKDYYFTYWKDGSTTNPRSFVITQDTTFGAYFDTDVTYTLIVEVKDSKTGYVTGGGVYKKNTNATIRAYANVGYTFAEWEDGNTSASRTVLMDRDQAYTAYFNPIPAGDNLSWTFDEVTGTLTISGTGNMNNWSSEKNLPWYNKNGSPSGYLPIRNVVIEEGVTSVGDCAFKNCSTIVSVSLPSTLTYIGRYAFRATNITSVTIPANVETIATSVFYDCASLQKITVLAEVPPMLSGNIFNADVLTFYLPCGSLSAYRESSYWYRTNRQWTYIEGAYDYVLPEEQVIVHQEPTCENHGTLIMEAIESEGYFFSQWNDGNTDNPRKVQLEANQHYEFVPEYIEGERFYVCKGYKFENPQTGKTYTINSDRVIGMYYFYVKTSNRPVLASADYPIMQIDRMYYGNAEKALRAQYAEINLHPAEIQSIEWAYSISNDKTADTYIKSDLLPSDEYMYAWVKYSVTTECGDTWSDTVLVERTPASDAVAASLPSTEGRDFWVGLILACDPDNSSAKQEPFIAVSTKEPTTIRITNPNQPNWSGVVRSAKANEWVVFTKQDIPLEYWYPEDIRSFNDVEHYAGRIQNFGIHVETDQDVSVFAAQRREYSYDAAFILPTPMLQMDYITQDYPPYNNNGNSYTQAVIVAVENNTNVAITPKTTTVDGHEAGMTYYVSLQKGQIYYVISRTDQSLSGTYVNADKPVAVFQGNTFTRVPAGGKGNRDCLYEQAMPVEYWGSKFVITRSLLKDANRVRVTAVEDGTTIYIDGQMKATINAGETYEFEMSIGDMSRSYQEQRYAIPPVIQQNATYLQTSCPVSVYSYDVGCRYQATETETQPVEEHSDKSYGDPSMVWIAPIEQRINDITFGACGTDKTTRHYINIVCRTEDTYLTNLSSSIRMSIPMEFMPVPGNPEYSYARVFLADDKNVLGEKVFRLTNPHGVIAHIYGHGFDESYAYSVGSAAVKRGLALNGETLTSGTIIDKQYCLGDVLALNAQVGTDEVDRIDWDFGDGTKIRNGKLQVEHLYEQAGTYDIKAKVYTHKECPFTLYEPEEMTFQVRVGVPDTLRKEYAICEGESFIYKGKLYSEAISDTIGYGCDSVEIVSLAINNCQTETPDTIIVDPTENTAEFIWPIWPGAYTYTLTVWADPYQQVMLCVLTFNAAGNLINIEFGTALYTAYSSAPMHVRKQKEQVIIVGTTTLEFTITGLEEGHTYYFELQAFDQYDYLLGSMYGSFTTGRRSHEGIENINKDKQNIYKLLRDGQIYILRGNKTYTVTGQQVR